MPGSVCTHFSGSFGYSSPNWEVGMQPVLSCSHESCTWLGRVQFMRWSSEASLLLSEHGWTCHLVISIPCHLLLLKYYLIKYLLHHESCEKYCLYKLLLPRLFFCSLLPFFPSNPHHISPLSYSVTSLHHHWLRPYTITLQISPVALLPSLPQPIEPFRTSRLFVSWWTVLATVTGLVYIHTMTTKVLSRLELSGQAWKL